MFKVLRKRIAQLFSLFLELLCVLPLVILALFSRWSSRRYDVGLGPQPLINNYYHKLALQTCGYSAQTFAATGNYITDRYDLDLGRKRLDLLPKLWKPLYLFIRALFLYRSLFIYFNGGPLLYTQLLRHLEPWLYKLANIKVVVMPYGSDVQNMGLSPNLYFRHAMTVDYPDYHKRYAERSVNIRRWTQQASWIISGCEWVDYMDFWHTLMLAHFSIDLTRWEPRPYDSSAYRPFRILHAPNHPTIKGTEALRKAVEQLKQEGLNLELIILRGVPNTEIQAVMSDVDIVADQFVVGWYAMFAIEAMSLEKPVMCYLREDLMELYQKAGLIEADEVPILNTGMLEITERLRWAYEHRNELPEIGRRGRAYVAKHHSLEAIGGVFASILANLGLSPSYKAS